MKVAAMEEEADRPLAFLSLPHRTPQTWQRETYGVVKRERGPSAGDTSGGKTDSDMCAKAPWSANAVI
ncbi:hypothetical protein GCM10009429_43820 [Dyella marensis]